MASAFPEVEPQARLAAASAFPETAAPLPAPKKPKRSVEQMARESARLHGVDEGIFLRLIRQESAGKAGAVSRKGALGLGQLMPDTAAELGVDPLDPEQNLEGSARYLRQNLDRFGGDYSLALAAYNAGPGAVEKFGGIPPFKETQDYVQKVMAKGVAAQPVQPAAANVPRGTSPKSTLAFDLGEEDSTGTHSLAAPALPETESQGGAESSFLGAIKESPGMLVRMLGSDPLRNAAGFGQYVGDYAMDVALRDAGDPDAANRLASRGLIASSLTSVIPGGPALQGGRALLGTLAARAGLGALGGAAGGAAEAAASQGNVVQGAVAGGITGAVVNPVVGGVAALVRMRLLKRMAESEVERAGRTTSAGTVRELADLVRTSQEIPGGIGGVAPEPGQVPLTGVPDQPQHVQVPFTPEPNVAQLPDAELERRLAVEGGRLPGAPPEPGVVEMPGTSRGLEPRRTVAAPPEPNVFAPDEARPRSTMGVTPEPGLLEGTLRAAPEPKPRVGAPAPEAPPRTIAEALEAPSTAKPEPGYRGPEPNVRTGARKLPNAKPGLPPAAPSREFVPPKSSTPLEDIERHIRQGTPVPGPVADQARREVAVATGAIPGTAVDRVIQALRAAPRIIKRQAEAQTLERGRRIKLARGVRPKGTGGEAGFRSQLSKLSGQRPTMDFESLRPILAQGDMDEIFNMVDASPYLDEFEKLTAQRGLGKLFGEEGGAVPTTDELRKLKEVFGDAFIKEMLDKRPTIDRLHELGIKGMGAWRSLVTSLDFSAPLTQGLYIGAANPKEFARAFFQMFRYAGSEQAFKALEIQIKNRPTYLLMKRAGLALSDMGSILGDREEAFASTWADKIPGVKQSARAYTGFLNRMRADVFDKLVRESRAAGIDPGQDLKFTKQLAAFVNDASGRGSLKFGKIDLTRHADLLNAGFFSPRLMASRVRLLNPALYVHQNPLVRKQALRGLLGITAGGATLMGLASAGGADVGLDPKDVEFGNIKVGNTRYNVFGGFTGYVRAAANLLPFAGGPSEGDRLDYVTRFAQNKASPAAGFAMDLLRGTDFKGQPLDAPLKLPGGEEAPVPQWIADRFVPMVLQDLWDAYTEWGWQGTLMAAPALFGVRIQTYE